MIHSVYFYLKPDLSEAQKADFLKAVESLRAIKSVDKAYIGTPAAVPARPVVDSSFSYGLTVVFKDVAAHNAYQVDPIHLRFVENNKSLWTKVQIYDHE